MRVLPALFALALFATSVFGEEAAQSRIVGSWTADARLFDKRIRARATPLEAKLSFSEDHALSGRIGDADIPPTRPHSKSPKKLMYRVLLPRPVRDLDELRKDHMIIIVTLGAGVTLDADFHLKSRFGFDPTMRAGHFDAKRVDR